MNNAQIPVNNQSPSPLERNSNNLQVHSIFGTIQGEGPFAGVRAHFIRLAGCNLQCPNCDTEYTEGSINVPISMLFEETQKLVDPPRLIVITGGEPFRQNLLPFVELLVGAGYLVQIETNGTLAPFGMGWGKVCWAVSQPHIYQKGVCHIVCSPKTGSISKALQPLISAYKYVMDFNHINPDDGLPILALNHTAHPQLARPHKDFNGVVYLQPADYGVESINKLNMQACVDSCIKFGYTLQLQIHKIIGVA